MNSYNYHSDPIAQRRRLREELNIARLKAELPQVAVAEAMDWSLAKLIRIENGTVGISVNDLKALLSHYRVNDPQKVAELIAIAKAAKRDDIFSGQLWYGLNTDDFEHAIEAQLAPANLILPPVSLTTEEQVTDNRFMHNESFWEEIYHERLRANTTFILEDFLLFEWFPRSPGLFHTKRGKFARQDAADHRMVRPAETSSYVPDPMVYDLYGKVRMLEGGLGCVRLLPKRIEGDTLWFMSASSTPVAHEGIPIALRSNDYDRCMQYITQYGVMPCSLTGKLNFLPKPLLSLYGDYTDVPGLYLSVEEVTPAHSSIELSLGPPSVSVAVTFGLDRTQMSAAYVTFIPGNNKSIDTALAWLDRYVQRHDGTIVTDFDEQTRRYPGAAFSLKKVCNGELRRSEIMPFTTPWYYRSDPVVETLMANQERLSDYRVHIDTVNLTGDLFNNIGSGAVIANRSSLANSMNVVEERADAEIADALQLITDFIERSGNLEAMENFKAFESELRRWQPKRSVLRSLWNGVEASLPSAAALSGTVIKIVSLFD